MDKIVGAWVREPEKKSEHAVLRVYSCALEDECPILAQKQCVHYAILSRGCVYGKLDIQKTPTKRSKSYRDELKKLKAQEVPMPQMAHNVGVHLIGDYYYLPYAHMDMNEHVPFLAHSVAFSLGKPFLKKEDFTPEVIVKLCQYRPYALFGGEIRTYQKEEVPKFLFHLKQRFPALFAGATELCPELLEKMVNISLIEKLETTLDKIPMTFEGRTGIGYRVKSLDRTITVLDWNGTTIKLHSDFNLILYFNGKKGSTYELIYEPDPEKTTVIVSDKGMIEAIAMEHPEVIK